MNVEGVNFRVLTTTTEEHDVVFIDCPKKRNCVETFDQDYFTAPARLLQIRSSNDNFKPDGNGKYLYLYQVTNETVINLEHFFENNIDFESQPADWFD